MIIIYLLIPLSVVIAAAFLGGFIWAVRSGQFEDTCTPAMRILADDPARQQTTPLSVEPNGVPTSER